MEVNNRFRREEKSDESRLERVNSRLYVLAKALECKESLSLCWSKKNAENGGKSLSDKYVKPQVVSRGNDFAA